MFQLAVGGDARILIAHTLFTTDQPVVGARERIFPRGAVAAVLAAVAAADALERATVERHAHDDLVARHAFQHQMLLHRRIYRQAERAGEGAGQFFPAPAQVGFTQRVIEGWPGAVAEQSRLVVGDFLPRASQIVGHQVDVIE
ncbi:hypothetical protein D3C78_1521710 [compost metagenome]